MERIIVITPTQICNPRIAIAACRAGELGLLDLGLYQDWETINGALETLHTQSGSAGRWGIRWELGLASRTVHMLAEHLPTRVPAMVLAGVSPSDLEEVKTHSRGMADQVYLEVFDELQARAAEAAGYDGIIVKGYEAGGRIGRQSSFILLQKLREQLSIPYWIQGGVGLQTAAALRWAGAQGVVLAEQLWLTQEAPFSPAEQEIWRQLDGSETTVIGHTENTFRVFSRSGRGKIQAIEQVLLAQDHTLEESVAQALTRHDADPLIPLGQDIAFAALYGKRYGTVGRVIAAFHEANRTAAARRAQTSTALAPNAPLAKAHGTRYPIVQGPMTRVSDTVAFAQAVAAGGGLPFFALAVMRASNIRLLLQEAAVQMGSQSWGVGILGFVPLELRQEQLEVIKEIKPPFAIIAGGRPSQAQELEKLGISTYLHVPSPGLLDIFLKEGARKFILEGSECGGHTGPRTSCVLWELAVERFLAMPTNDAEHLQVLFAGGIHDAASAATVVTIAGPLIDRGIKVGVLIGTAYLFTKEAVQSGAVTQGYQDEAVACNRTVLLQSGTGLLTRCADTAYCIQFNTTRRNLHLARKSPEEILEALERLNLGRLRIASKGIVRTEEEEAEVATYTLVDAETQKREGMYMLGDVATLRRSVVTIADLHRDLSEGSQALLANTVAADAPFSIREDRSDDVAIVGMACVFPGALDVRRFWQNILNQVDSIREVTDDRWRPSDFFNPDRSVPDMVYSKWGGFLDDVQFDPMKYGIPPASIPSIEPMQLLAVEVARKALEDAGWEKEPFPRDRTGVIFGVGGVSDLSIDYIFRTMLKHYLPRVEGVPKETKDSILDTLYWQLPKWTEDSFPGILGNVIAGRVANRLDLRGPNFVVDAACASSLAALDVGIKLLQSDTADAVLVGAADGSNNAVAFMSFAKTRALSPRGRCRPFDASADGIVISEGVSALVLKRLSDAERLGDRIYAVIKGIGSSSDGRNRSLTAPHPDGQVKAVKRAFETAAIDPSTVELVEAHGTGTAVGDKAEIESLNAAFNTPEADRQYCAVGSVKSMIGHTKVAAGLASVIKAALALKHRVLPPTVGVDTPNPYVAWPQTPFYVSTETRPWLRSRVGHPRRCGVSAFGFGGTNFHTILQEYQGDFRPGDPLDLGPRDVEIFALSRRTRPELITAGQRLLHQLESVQTIDLSELAYSIYREEIPPIASHQPFPCRLAILATSPLDLREKLRAALKHLEETSSISNPQGIYYGEPERATGIVCFLFPGQGSQRVNMLRDLVVANGWLHLPFEQADALLAGRLPRPLSRYIYPLPVFTEEERKHQQEELNATQIAQPALGAVELAAFEVLKQFGIHPDVVGGHSYGEYVALWAAGVFSQEDLIRLSEKRGRIAAGVSQTNPGAMASVQADADTTSAVLRSLPMPVFLANLNAPDQTVISGPTQALDKAAEAFRARNLSVKRIPVTTAFHTPEMKDASRELAGILATCSFHEPKLPVSSNTLGGLYPSDPQEIRRVLARHIAEPVKFCQQIQNLHQNGGRIFIEVGPGRILSNLVDRILPDAPHVTLPMDTPGRGGWLQLGHCLAQTFAQGLSIDFSPWFRNRGLVGSSVDDCVMQARARANPDPPIWRVNGDRATPWHTSDTTFEQPSAAASPAPAQKTEPSPIQGNSSLATKDGQGENHRERNHESVQTHVQTLAHRLRELQREQYHLNEQILNIQETLMVNLLEHQQTNGQMGPNEAAPIKPTPSAPHTRPAAPPPPLPCLSVKPASTVTKSGAPTSQAALLPSTHKASPVPVETKQSEPLIGTSTKDFQATLLRIVSARTGYPVDMLDLDAHMEADLGIDSIKKIEIFSSLKEYQAFLQGQNEETFLEELAGLKTLRRIIEWYDSNRSISQAQETPFPPSLSSGAQLSTPDQSKAGSDGYSPPHVGRYSIEPVEAALGTDARRAFPTQDVIWLLGQAPVLSGSLEAALSADGYRVRHVVPGQRTHLVDLDRLEVDFSSPTLPAELSELLKQRGETVGALINLMELASTNQDAEAGQPDTTRKLFRILQALEQDLKTSAKRGGGWLINFTGIDGQFGCRGTRDFPVPSAGSLGLVKTIAREWPTIRVKCIDVDLTMDPYMLQAQVFEEIVTEDPLMEVGLTEKGRYKLTLREDPTPKSGSSSLNLTRDSVILVLGGASGITAAVAKALARSHHPRLVLVGRSARSEPESPRTREIQDASKLREVLIQEMRSTKGHVAPAEIERALKRILRAREIQETLAYLAETGSSVDYYSLDVRNAAGLAELIDHLYATYGRIDGVIHGAGVLDDKLLREKSLDSFSQVYDTKVIPAQVLADKLRPEGLKFLVLFASVAGRFGNIGQSDYSAANEVLNKTADRLYQAWPSVHVASLNWGPWNSGMVSDYLRQLYAERNIDLIPLEIGAHMCLEEIHRGRTDQPEVVITASLREIAEGGLGKAPS